MSDPYAADHVIARLCARTGFAASFCAGHLAAAEAEGGGEAEAEAWLNESSPPSDDEDDDSPPDPCVVVGSSPEGQALSGGGLNDSQVDGNRTWICKCSHCPSAPHTSLVLGSHAGFARPPAVRLPGGIAARRGAVP
eukprot:EG_transcript_43110